MPEHPVVDVADSSYSDYELPDIDPPRQLPVHKPQVGLREGVVLLHRLPVEKPVRPPTPLPKAEQEVDWEALEGELAIIDEVQLLLTGPEQPLIDWALIVEVVVVVVVAGQTIGSISSRTLAYDCLCTLALCTASMIATS